MSATPPSAQAIVPPGLPMQSEAELRLLQYLNEDSDHEENFDHFNEPTQEPREESGEPNDEVSPWATPQGSDVPPELSTPLTFRNTATTLNRLARRQQLHPYQITKVENLLTHPLSVQIGLMCIELYTLQNQVDKILLHQPPFTISKALNETIASYALGVVLSENLRMYKGSTPTEYTMAVILKNNINVSPNLKQDPYASNLVTSAISAELTQIRHRIKRLIKESITREWSVYQLAQKVVEGSQCNVSVPLCARLALMRDVFSNYDGSDFWDKVDARLEYIRKISNGNVAGIRKILSRMLKDDRSKYAHAGLQPDIPRAPCNFQQSIDDSL